MKFSKSFLAALVTFTRLPISIQLDAADFKQATLQLPCLGLGIGLLIAGVLAALSSYVAPEILLFCALLVPILLSGAMHEDGLADFSDGIFGGHSREQRLLIMKDPHIGSFGVLALILVLAGNYLGLLSLDKVLRPELFLSTLVLSRCLALGLSLSLPYVRSSGSRSATYIPDPAISPKILFWFWPILPVFAVLDWRISALHILVSIVLFYLLRRLLKKAIGGYTGDCLGAAIKIGECVLSLASALAWPLIRVSNQ